MIELSSIYCVIKVHLQDWGNIFKKGHLVQFSIGNFGYRKHSSKAFLFFFPQRHISIFLVEQVSLLFLGGTSFQSFHGLHVEVRDFKLFSPPM